MKKLWMLLLALLLGCNETANKPVKVMNYRFVVVNTVTIQPTGTWDGPMSTGVIYMDTETQAKYLYIWGGGGNGGPAMVLLKE
jgi:hypothetical protein